MVDKKVVSYLYINGIGDGRYRFGDRLVDFWWRIHGVRLIRFSVDWYKRKGLDELINLGSSRVLEMLENSSAVTMIGSSAGASLAANIFHGVKSDRTILITSRGRVRRGEYNPHDKMSLEAWLPKSKLFYDSVIRAEKSIGTFNDSQRSRVLIMAPLIDEVVPVQTMTIEGAVTHKSFAFGHSWGYLAHMVSGVTKIKKFVNEHIDK